MLYVGIDTKAVFQAAVLDPDSGELSASRFEPRASVQCHSDDGRCGYDP
jgi:hypothetical protein